MDDTLFMYVRQSISDLFKPLTYFFGDSRVSRSSRNGFRVFKYITLQVFLAFFHDQHHLNAAKLLDERYAIKRHDVRVL